MSIPNPFRPVCGKPGGGLPPGYTALEYIESTGTQYLNTLQSVSATTRWELDIVATTSDWGGHGAFVGNTAYFSVWHTANFGFHGGGSPVVALNTNMSGGKRTLLTLDAAMQKCFAANKDGQTFESEIQLIAQSSYPLFIFARNHEGSAADFAKCRCFGSVVKRNGIVVQRLVPALNSNNKPGMYDMVGGNFYTNAGTGEFSYA